MQGTRKLAATAAVLLGAGMSVLGITMPLAAHADEVPGWPVRLVTTMVPDQMIAFGNDSMSLLNCGNLQQAESFQYVHDGVNASSLPMSTVGTASPPHDGISCGNNEGLATADGTFYTTHIAEDSNGVDTLTFVAMKNGRTLWATDLGDQKDPVCSVMSTWGSEAHDEVMTNASVGSDGNIYGLVQQNRSGCATYLAGVSGVDGTMLFKVPLTTNGAFKGSRVWVYDDNILTIDNTGLLRQFGYDGTEDTSAAYQFPNTLGTFGSAYANADGRVFVVGACAGSVTDTYLAYHDPNGDNNIAESDLGCSPNVSYTPGGGGSLVAYDYSSTATTFQFSTTPSTNTSVTLPTPPDVAHVFDNGYWQDQAGNAVMVRQFYNGGWYSAGVSVDFINGSTDAVSNLFLMAADTDHPNPAYHVGDIANGYLYALICHDQGQCPNTASQSIDGWIHKVPLPGFGTPVKDTGGFATYVSTKLNYVAMGDSYSSGEGNPLFDPTTDISGVNKCHRSDAAYPRLLSETSALNLDLSDFVACSGATTDNVLNGQENEPAQVGALNDTANVVTITIGGNDIKFVDFATACVLGDCSVGSPAYATSMDLITNSLPGALTRTYETILRDAPNANVYVVGYPQVVEDKGVNDQPVSTCSYFWRIDDGWANAQAARHLVSQLDLAISTAVSTVQQESADYSNRLHFIDTNASDSPFVGHYVCSGSSYFQNVDQWFSNSAYVFHPNQAGHDALAAIVGVEINAGQ